MSAFFMSKSRSYTVRPPGSLYTLKFTNKETTKVDDERCIAYLRSRTDELIECRDDGAVLAGSAVNPKSYFRLSAAPPTVSFEEAEETAKKSKPKTRFSERQKKVFSK